MLIAQNIHPHKIAHAIPDFLNPILKGFNVCLAGGAGRRFFGETDTADWDLFIIASGDKLLEKDQVSDYLVNIGFEVVFLCEKDELRSFRRGSDKVQIIDVREYLSPEELLDSFDIYAGMFGFFKEKLYFTKQSIRDFRRKHISLNKLTYPISTINRISKYRAKNPSYKTTFAAQDFVRLLTEMIKNGEEISDLVYVD